MQRGHLGQGSGLGHEHPQGPGLQHGGQAGEADRVRLDQHPGGPHAAGLELRGLGQLDRRGDDHERAAATQTGQGARRVLLTADEVDDAVHVARDLGEVLAPVVDRVVHAELAQEPVLGGRGGAPDLGPARLGDLHGQVADAAGGGVDEHTRPGAELQRVDDGLPGGQPGQGHGARRHEVDAVGDALDLARGRGGELRVGVGRVGEARHAEDPVAHLEAGDPGAHLHDLAGEVPAQDQGPAGGEAAAHAAPLEGLPVDRVDPRRADANEDLGRTGLGDGELPQGEGSGGRVGAEDGSHVRHGARRVRVARGGKGGRMALASTLAKYPHFCK